jgi:hypothetical protein
MPAIHRNRVIYQSEALFVSPDSTGYHFTGKGGYGLMTPPADQYQVCHPSESLGTYPAGWHPKDGLDTWPAWNGSCDDVDVKATFNGTVEVENAQAEVELIAQNAGLAGNGLQIIGDGNATVTQLITAAGVAINVVTGGSLVPDNNVVLAIANGVDPVIAANDPINSPVVNSGNTVTVNANVAGADGNVSFTIAGGQTVNAAIAAYNAGAAVNAQISLDANSAVIGTDTNDTGADVTIQLINGADAIFASLNDPNVAIENGQIDVEIEADDFGPSGNVVLGPFNGVDTVATAVATHNAVQGSPQLTVNAGGTAIPDNQETITLSGGRYAAACNHGTIIKQLKRVQTVNYGFTINRTDINQFGMLSRLDSIVTEQPTVNMDFSYYLIDGANERLLEFNIDGYTNSLSGALSPELYQAGNNFFLLTVPESRDAINGDVRLDNESGFGPKSKTVVALGNGFITDYTVDIAVGSIPTVNISVEGMNIQTDIGETGLNLPAINLTDGSKMSDAWDYDDNDNHIFKDNVNTCTGLYSLPASDIGFSGCGDDIAALRPGDVVVNIENSTLFAVTPSGTPESVVDYQMKQKGSAHLQSCSINIPMSRTTLQRLGNTFGFSKAIDVPVVATLSASASLSDVKRGNVADLLCDCGFVDLEILIYPPECAQCNMKTGEPAMRFGFKGCRLESENFSATIGDNKTVDLTFTVQVGGADDPSNGVFISGYEAKKAHGGIPPAWTGVGGAINIPAHGTESQYLEKGLSDLFNAGLTRDLQILGFRE